jgi:hypothetical protein
MNLKIKTLHPGFVSDLWYRFQCQNKAYIFGRWSILQNCKFVKLCLLPSENESGAQAANHVAEEAEGPHEVDDGQVDVHILPV